MRRTNTYLKMYGRQSNGRFLCCNNKESPFDKIAAWWIDHLMVSSSSSQCQIMDTKPFVIFCTRQHWYKKFILAHLNTEWNTDGTIGIFMLAASTWGNDPRQCGWMCTDRGRWAEDELGYNEDLMNIFVDFKPDNLHNCSKPKSVVLPVCWGLCVVMQAFWCRRKWRSWCWCHLCRRCRWSHCSQSCCHPNCSHTHKQLTGKLF